MRFDLSGCVVELWISIIGVFHNDNKVSKVLKFPCVEGHKNCMMRMVVMVNGRGLMM